MSNCTHRFIPKRSGENGALCGKRCRGKFCAKHQRARIAKRNRAKVAALDALLKAWDGEQPFLDTLGIEPKMVLFALRRFRQAVAAARKAGE